MMKIFLIDFPNSQAIVCGYLTAQEARTAAEKANTDHQRAISATQLTVPTIIFRDILDEGADAYGQDVNCSSVEIGDAE